MTRYEPADSFETPRFSGVRTFMRLPSVRDLENADAAIVGAPFDIGCDVVEVCPPYDGPGQVTALVAANVAHDFLGLIALQKKNRDG